MSCLLKLGFGRADVVVAIPDCWLDVETMADLEEAGALFAAEHGRRMRVATKYPNLTRRFFAAHGVVHYRTVESLGATEGAPAAGLAEAIVDITSTGSTLKANGLRNLSDGIILEIRGEFGGLENGHTRGADHDPLRDHSRKLGSASGRAK